MPKVAKKQSITLNHVEQAVNSPILTFITDCDKKIDVQENSILEYIDATEINHYQECDGAYWDPASITIDCITDAKEYFENHFEEVTQMYFDQVLILTMKEVSNHLQALAKHTIQNGEPIDQNFIKLQLERVYAEYGVRMEVA